MSTTVNARRAAIAIVLVAFVATTSLYLPSLLLQNNLVENHINDDVPHGRRLSASVPSSRINNYNHNPIPNALDIEAALHTHAVTHPNIDTNPLPPYNLENVLLTMDIFQNTFSVVIYDPEEDAFIAYYHKHHTWIGACAKLIGSFRTMAKSLRKMYPQRFQKGLSHELAIALSSGDFPSIKPSVCMERQDQPCVGEEMAPILQFGSVFSNPVLPSMIAMPNPQSNHLGCFYGWVEGLKNGEENICEYYLPRSVENPNGLVFGETVGLTSWDELIPQVVWRGTDFPGYLHNVRHLRQPDLRDVENRLDSSLDTAAVAIDAMKDVYDDLIPRWKGVVWTAMAEWDAHHQQQEQQHSEIIPWANIKFADCIYETKKTAARDVPFYQKFASYGIPAAGESMNLEELAKYKYHIDIGGGGGTTWSGTLEKLALPGLLFHHVTPTKDYNHDKLAPWVHYVPIKEDLSDLKEKYDWAENNPLLAQQISERATMFAKSLGTVEGFREMYTEFYQRPLENVIDAYQPTMDESWKVVMQRLTGENMVPVMKCGPYYCETLTENPTSWKQIMMTDKV